MEDDIEPHGGIFNEAVSWLKKQLKEASTFLPSCSVMSKQSGFSVATLKRALKHLSDTGLIIRTQGRRAMPVSENARACFSSATNSMIEHVKTFVAQGKYIAKEPLPKFTWFQAQFSLSPVSVTKAFQFLAQESVVHKAGKKWIAGPLQTDVNLSGSMDRPTVVVIARNEYDIRAFFDMSYTSAFSHPLCAEMTKCNIRMVFAQVEKNTTLKDITSGLIDTTALIRLLGKSYYGSIFVCQPLDTPDLEIWIRRIGEYGQPVLMFDHADQNSLLTSSKFPHIKRYYRFSSNESAGIDCALHALQKHGHTSIGIPHYQAPTFSWVTRRISRIQSQAANYNKPLTIHVTKQKEHFWRFQSEKYWSFAKVLKDHHTKSSQFSVKAQSNTTILFNATPSLASLIKTENLTAIIAPNDRMACEYYYWMREAGIEIPRKISLISFDNSPESHVFPISSIDFGFSRLSYLAAHVFIGDIPVLADSQGNVKGECSFIDRGSLGFCET